MTIAEAHEKLLAAAIPLARAKFPGYASEWVYRQIGELMVEEELRRMTADGEVEEVRQSLILTPDPTTEAIRGVVEAELGEAIRRRLWDNTLPRLVRLLFGDPAARPPESVLKAPRPLRPAGRPLRPVPEAP